MVNLKKKKKRKESKTEIIGLAQRGNHAEVWSPHLVTSAARARIRIGASTFSRLWANPVDMDHGGSGPLPVSLFPLGGEPQEPSINFSTLVLTSATKRCIWLKYHCKMNCFYLCVKCFLWEGSLPNQVSWLKESIFKRVRWNNIIIMKVGGFGYWAMLQPGFFVSRPRATPYSGSNSTDFFDLGFSGLNTLVKTRHWLKWNQGENYAEILWGYTEYLFL